MQSLKNRVEKLEQQLAPGGEPPNIRLEFVRADRFCTAYLNLKTGEEISQSKHETDADFVARAQAAGFGGIDHERT